MSIAFLAALARIPLGTAVAIEFLGPLTVAAVRSHSPRALAWPGFALVGVILLTEPWAGSVNLLGVAFAVLAGTCWARCILLTQRIGDRIPDIDHYPRKKQVALPWSRPLLCGVETPRVEPGASLP